MKSFIFLLITFFSLSCNASAQAVYVEYVMDYDYKAIISASSGKYLIEVGTGCISLWRYKGKQIIIYSPGVFLGVGSKVILPNLNQECRIWNSESI